MSFSTFDASECRAVDIVMCEAEFLVKLHDGNSIHVPYDWFPRLLHSAPEEREDWMLIDEGRGIHWESIDEDISVPGLVAGHKSGESEKSLVRWRAAREQVKA